MREVQYLEVVEPGDFARFVHECQVKDFSQSEAWKSELAELIANEGSEFLNQHGNGFMLLLPILQEHSPDLIPPPSLKDKMADELSDLLWFTTLAANLVGEDAVQLAAKALTGHTRTNASINHYSDLQMAVVEHAAGLKVINKTGLLMPEIAEELRHTTLADNPWYVFMRTQHRLCRALENGIHDMSPPTATELEPIVELGDAIGDFMCVLAYIAKNNLDWDIETVARYNAHKLSFRKLFGKTVSVP